MKKVFIVLLSALMVLSLFGCGSTEEKEAENAVKSFTQALAKADFEEASKYYQGDISDFEIDVDVENVYKLLLSKLKCTVISTTKKSDDRMVVTAQFKNIASGKIVADFAKQYLSWGLSAAFSTDKPDEKEIKKKTEEFFKNAYNTYKKEIVTQKCDVVVVKQDGKWVVSNQNITALIESVFGGMISALNVIGGSLFQ